MSHLTATLLGYEVDQSLGVTNRKWWFYDQWMYSCLRILSWTEYIILIT